MPRRPRDANQLAKAITDIAIGEARNDSHDKPPGRARGGHARAAKLSAERRREIARTANGVRWAKDEVAAQAK